VRVTAGSYYNNIYGENNKLNRQLFDVNKQIASGQKIQYAHENPGVFVDTLRLDDEIATLEQTKSSAQNAYKFSTQTDTAIGEIAKTFESLKVKLVNAASDSNSQSSLDAIAKEMRGLENYLKTLSNTSINGQYIFSGTATAIKPFDGNGNYQGNDKSINAFLGSGVKQTYNISGSQLFLGEESKVNRTVTTNVEQFNLTKQFPHNLENNAISSDTTNKVYITATDTIRDLMGDTDIDSTNNPNKMSHFYLQGTRSNGDTFKQKIDIPMTATVSDLMQKISDSYGSDQVNVTLNTKGQIEISDKFAGSSKLDFHIVGAVDHGVDGIDSADVTSLNALQSATSTTDFNDILSGNKDVYVKEFIKSGLTSSDPTITIQGLTYDQYMFDQQGSKLTSNVAQIIRDTNEVATSATKLVDVSGMNNVNGRSMSLKGNNVNGVAYDITLNLNTPSTFTDNLTSTTYNIYGTNYNDLNNNGIKEVGEGIPSSADQITYQQLMDVVNMVVTDSLPTVDILNATNPDPVDYDNAVANANAKGKVSLSNDGKLTFEDLIKPVTSASLSISDTTTNSFFPPIITGNALAFQANNSITIRDPKNNLFTQVDQMIKSVEEGNKYANSSNNNDPRNLGVQNSIQMIDDLIEHVSRLQAQAGSNSQVLDSTVNRSDLLIVSTKTLRSDVIDTDIAEATLKMQQLSLNYQALLSNISKVSHLSLVNYL
jgi:flagellar hook-associated protein 3 FlgL